MTEKWIKDAFNKAVAESGSAVLTAVHIREFLDSEMPRILNKWSKIIGKERSLKLAKVLAADEELSDIVETLTEVFFTAGYVLRLTEEENGNQG